MILSDLERIVLTQLDACRLLYEQAEAETSKLYQINNAMSLWSSLRGFFIAKLEEEKS